ncbi:MAG: HEAT repeat domain-containing protein [Planctomycetota bacterium]
MLQLLWIMVLAGGFAWAPAAVAQPADKGAKAAEPPAPEPVAPSASSGVASLFEDFVHYARLGKFEEARAFATSLLGHPDLDPQALLAIADRDRKSVETLITVINNSSIGEEAKRVLDVLHEGEFRRRQNPERIDLNIGKLAGPPQTEYNAIQSLIDSGEYAVPWLVQALRDRTRQALWPRILRALPQIGEPAVTPLAVALEVPERDLRHNMIRTLGELGYPHAVPYLKKLLAAPDLPADTRALIEEALTSIEQRTGRRMRASAAEDFVQFGEQYYDEQGTLRADPRRTSANVWYWRDNFIDAVVIPRELYGPVMAMRCAEEALRLEPAREAAIALWLAANIRREARLGMDVESGEVVANDVDATRPAGFPRAIYFSRASGARYDLEVLDRAVRDKDTPVALGAIAALRAIAGESALVGVRSEGEPLVQALLFPDVVVRIKAALALAEACPKSQFRGSEWVVPVLAEALGQTGTERFVVVDPDPANLNRVMESLRQGGAEVLGEADFYTAMERVRRELRSVSGLFISCGIESPGVRRAVGDLRREFLFQMAPVVLLRGTGDYETARDLAAHDPRVAHLAADAEGSELIETLRGVTAQSGRRLPDPEQALHLAREAADALLRLCLDGRTVLNVAAAEPALLATLASADDEDLRRKAAAVLAWSRSQTAQRALAEVALDGAQTSTLRVAAFAALADSAKLNGPLLSDTLLSRLVAVAADESDLVLRTAASQALGALNLTDNKASEIIRKYYRG